MLETIVENNRKARRALETMQGKGKARVYLIIDDSLLLSVAPGS